MNNTAATQSVGGALPKGFGAQSSAPTTFNPVQKTTPISHSREPAPMGSGMGQFSSGRSQTDTAAGPLFISKPPQTNVPVLAKTDTPATTTEAPSPPGATAATISLPSGKENVLGERNPSVLAKLTRGSLMAPLVLGVRKR
ncbi:hypothetical protein SARC_00363 [Sphaeroforma arctica JP610]|uniref:Uncharacterized protein n=1 Tax=Sphaeroforma arctica JP610 TaxID=667725 RepID=A0A0L0GFA0_9EUKA|nr:hypothetical protein SARC_00363 [Sphaeroforma arctica JP610]KNC87539.1 hypothetical protein SARC_00363 [Sphaeroforma arctica JP610]|eukprot:XP_014161441.1 hypothetical protein SARC_00363 [Sphaeroforma arctica JP610]